LGLPFVLFGNSLQSSDVLDRFAIGYAMRRFLVVLLLLLPLTACSSTVTRPTLLHPGPAYFQRNNAQQFDPYPPNDMGPEIVGGRPIDFQKPPDEVRRARQHSQIAPWRTAPLY